MSKVAAIFLCLFILFGCNKSKDTSDFKYDFTVLLILPGSVTENGIDKKTHDAMFKTAEELKVNVICNDNVEPTQVKQVLSEAVPQNVDFVIGLGEQYISPLTQAALSYPNIKFAVIGRYSGNLRNFGSLSYLASYSYLAGAVAAIKSKTGKIGSLESDDLPKTKEELNAFIAGAKRVKPNIEMYSMVLNKNSEDLALKCADTFKQQKVDVINVNCNQAGLAVHKWANENNIYTIGNLDDQGKVAPRAVVTSVIIDIRKLLSFGTEMAMIGKWQGRSYRFGMTDNIARLSRFRGTLNSRQQQLLEDIYRELASHRGEFPGMIN